MLAYRGFTGKFGKVLLTHRSTVMSANSEITRTPISFNVMMLWSALRPHATFTRILGFFRGWFLCTWYGKEKERKRESERGREVGREIERLVVYRSVKTLGHDTFPRGKTVKEAAQKRSGVGSHWKRGAGSSGAIEHLPGIRIPIVRRARVNAHQGLIPSSEIRLERRKRGVGK